MKRILFIGHDASRSGAPIGLLHLLKWLRANRPDLEIDLLLLRSGDLEAEYRTAANVYTLPDDRNAGLLSLGYRRLRERYGRKLRTGKLAPFRRKYDVVIGNTIASLEYLAHFKAKGSPAVCWMHELEYAISRFFSQDEFLGLSGKIDHFISVSNAVEENLRRAGVKTASSVVYEIAPELPGPSVDGKAVRRELGFPEDCFLIGGGGSVEWRKGTDVFLQIAARIAAADDNIRFVWVGGRTIEREDDFARIEYDLTRMELGSRVKFTGLTAEPGKYLSAIDVFALTSREDPFPLICLEAAGFGKPVLCFDKSGGMPEFIGEDCGFIVPYLDTEAFAAKIFELSRDPALAERLGARARAKAREMSSVDTIAPKIVEIAEKTAALKR